MRRRREFWSDGAVIVELPGMDKKDLQIQAKENTVRISGNKSVRYPEGVSVHRGERLSGEFVARCRSRCNSIRMALGPNTGMGYLHCFSLGPLATNRGQSRSNNGLEIQVKAGASHGL
jgi:hypothetical protein